MHKTSLLQVIFVFVFNLSLAQNTVTQVTYKTKMNLNDLPERIANLSPDVKQAFLKSQEKANTLQYVLYFNNTESLFFLTDSIASLEHDIYDNATIKLIKREKKKKFYKNLKDKKVIEQKIMGGEKLLITGKFNQLKWQLTNQQKTIGNYVCFKAILTDGNRLLGFGKNMLIQAWYAPEIAVPFGPMNFEGLPGLILELGLGRKTYYASAVKFNVNKKIAPPTQGRVILQKAYGDFLHEFGEKVLSKKNRK